MAEARKDLLGDAVQRMREKELDSQIEEREAAALHATIAGTDTSQSG